MTIEADCSKCQYIYCRESETTGRVIVNKQKEANSQRAGIPIGRCSIQGDSNKEANLVTGMGWSYLLPVSPSGENIPLAPLRTKTRSGFR